MAKAADRRAKHNQAVVLYHVIAAGLISLFFVFFRLFRHEATAGWAHWCSLLVTSPVYVACLRMLSAHAEIGVELFQSGLVEYCWDLVWVTMFVQLASCASDWFWLIYTIPPMIAAYYAWTSVIYPWISRPDQVASEGEDAALAKKRAKHERQMRRAKGK